MAMVAAAGTGELGFEDGLGASFWDPAGPPKAGLRMVLGSLSALLGAAAEGL